METFENTIGSVMETFENIGSVMETFGNTYRFCDGDIRKCYQFCDGDINKFI